MPARIRKSMPWVALQLARELLDRVEHVERGEDRPLGVVLVGDRGAEEREHRVALELGDRALVAEDGARHEVERLVDDRRPVLGIHLLREGRRADDVGEERGDGLALAGEPRGAHLRRSAARARPRSGGRGSPSSPAATARRAPGRSSRRTSRRARRWPRSAGRSAAAIRRSSVGHRTPAALPACGAPSG